MEQKQQKTVDNKALRKEITVYSEKYDIHGKVLDYGVVTKFVFNYNGKDLELGIHNNPLMDTDYVQTGRQILESYIENLSTKDRNVMLHNWYIEDHLSQRNGRYALAHGIVTGHTRSEWESVSGWSGGVGFPLKNGIDNILWMMYI